MEEPGTGNESRKRESGGLFEDLSLAQVAAGALAAVTSLLLSSRIGWGGSVIGVAVGSVVSTVSSQVYKKFFQRGADKLKDIATGDAAPSQGPTGTSAMPRAEGEAAAGAGGPAAASATSQAHPVESDEAIRRASAQTGRSATTGTRVVSPRLEQKARQRKRAKVQKGVIAVSIVSAILAVIVSAGVVSCATSGEGIGSKPAPDVKVADQKSSDSDTSASEASSPQTTAGASGDSADSKEAQGTSGSSGSDERDSGSTGGASGSKGSANDAGSGTSSSGTAGKGSNESPGTNANGGSGSATASSSDSADSTATSSQSTDTASEATDSSTQS